MDSNSGDNGNEPNRLNVESVLQILRMRDFVPRFPPKTRLCVMKAYKNTSESGKKRRRRRKKRKETSESFSDNLVREAISLMREDTRLNPEDEKIESTLFDKQTLYNTARNSFEYGEEASESEIQERVKAIMEKEKKSRSMIKFNEKLEVVLQKYGLKQ